MIAEISGKILHKFTTSIIIDCSGVGYQIFIPTRQFESMPEVGDNYSLPVLLVVREDSMTLYGFSSYSEKEFFEQLISISGIGPKTAIGILSAASSSEIKKFILFNDTVSLSKFPGIGKKTAERIVLELKNKTDISDSEADTSENLIKTEALSALVTLGYSRNLAGKLIEKAIKSDPTSSQNSEKLIKISLSMAMK